MKITGKHSNQIHHDFMCAYKPCILLTKKNTSSKTDVGTEIAMLLVPEGKGLRAACESAGAEVDEMTEEMFRSRIFQAYRFKRLGDDTGYYSGYIRGLRRLYHGKTFGTELEHKFWMSLCYDKTRWEMGRGYRHGFAGLKPEIN